MSNTVLYGVVGSEPTRASTKSGFPATSFRLALNYRHLNGEGHWEDGPTSWFSVQAYRKLAQNIQTSVAKGDRVIVTGRIMVREWQREDGRMGRQVEITAESVGPDLRFVTCRSARTRTESTSADTTLPSGQDEQNPEDPSAKRPEVPMLTLITAGGREEFAAARTDEEPPF